MMMIQPSPAATLSALESTRIAVAGKRGGATKKAAAYMPLCVRSRSSRFRRGVY
jgi:hypothetical protein